MLKSDSSYLNIIPLGFQVNYSYKPLPFIKKLGFGILSSKSSFTEIVRALDIFEFVTNLSHQSMQITNFPTDVSDHGGKILYYTRLWDPGRNNDSEEKERRLLMNSFRINAVRIIKKYYPNSNVGLYPCPLANKIAPELVLNLKATNKKNYLDVLKHSDICIADDGLKDSLGWKIGEYALFGKSIISTPINIKIPNFVSGKNYLELPTRNSFEYISENIEVLLKDKEYMIMGLNNYLYAKENIYPDRYFENILNHINKNSITSK